MNYSYFVTIINVQLVLVWAISRQLLSHLMLLLLKTKPWNSLVDGNEKSTDSSDYHFVKQLAKKFIQHNRGNDRNLPILLFIVANKSAR